MTTTSDSIREQLTAISIELRQAQDDTALYDRISKAKAKAASLTKLASELTSALNDALAAEAKQALQTFESRFRDLVVTRRPSDGLTPGLANDMFTISYEQLAWHYDAHENLWTPVSVGRFADVEPRMLAYMLEHRPDLIPDDLKALCPGDVFEAMDRYFTAKSRGSFGW